MEDFESRRPFGLLQDLLTRQGRRRKLSEGEGELGCVLRGVQQDAGPYVQRQFLKLLGDVLTGRKNRKAMLRYVNSKENLILIMKLMRHKSTNIAFEAFHIFKIFVANPKKQSASPTFSSTTTPS